ncbi:MAG: FAD-binding protein, partial [Pseudonocardiaceae bacterium]
MGRDPVRAGWSRRQFLWDAATTGLITMSGLLAAPASAGAVPAGAKVAVFGGGVAGLSAALELAERGFRVT